MVPAAHGPRADGGSGHRDTARLGGVLGVGEKKVVAEERKVAPDCSRSGSGTRMTRAIAGPMRGARCR